MSTKCKDYKSRVLRIEGSQRKGLLYRRRYANCYRQCKTIYDADL